MKAKCVLLLGLLACQTESIESTTTQELTVGNFCEAKFPPLAAWDGKPLPVIDNGTLVVTNTKYTGWQLFAIVDKTKATIPYAVYVHESMQAKIVAQTLRYALVGPGGNPPPPPCDVGPTVRCGQWHVAYALRVDTAAVDALEDCETCNLK